MLLSAQIVDNSRKLKGFSIRDLARKTGNVRPVTLLLILQVNQSGKDYQKKLIRNLYFHAAG